MILSQNKKAFADYEVLEKIEAGIVLTGPEVKSARAGQVNLKGSFVEVNYTIRHSQKKRKKTQPHPSSQPASAPRPEAFVRNIHISPYKQAPNPAYNPTAKRKLLLHQKEILKIATQLDTKGTTVVPLDFHLSKNHIKVTIGICRGKKKYDRREELKKKGQNLEIRRALKKFAR